MKRILVAITGMALGLTMTLGAQEPAAPVTAPKAQTQAPHAWGDKNHDGQCDMSGMPVGQGRQGMGGRSTMGRGMKGRMATGGGRGMGGGMGMGMGGGMGGGMGMMAQGKAGDKQQGCQCGQCGAKQQAAPAPEKK